MEYVSRQNNRPLPFSRPPSRDWGHIRKSPWGILGFSIVLLFVLTTIFAPWIAPYEASKQDFTAIFTAPSSEHLLGTDNLGRDLFSRLVFGSRIAMSAAIPAVSIGLTAGLVLGLLAGYLGGWVDNIIVILLNFD